jgi:hypothetical protein
MINEGRRTRGAVNRMGLIGRCKSCPLTLYGFGQSRAFS